jgi:hypothetical protein
VGDNWLHRAVCRQRAELWVTVGYIELCVGNVLKYVRLTVTWTCVLTV